MKNTFTVDIFPMNHFLIGFCYQTGLLYMYQNWHSFNEEKSTNAFAYFTEVFKRGIAKGFNDLYKKKGDSENNIKLISIQSSNDGQGLHSL